MNQFKYTARFDNVVSASTGVSAFNISKASLESLRGLIPDSVDLDRNIDLIGVAFNAAVVNRFNKNGDGIDTASAVLIKDYFIHKPTNIEHQKDNVVGHIVSAGFSKYDEGNSFISEIEPSSSEPFNIALGAVIYKTVNPAFAAALLESSDPSGEFYHSISASWEIGFNDYVVALGGDGLDSAEIVTDPKRIKDLSKFLKSFGGEGRLEDGTTINRLITGDIFPLGIGFTNNPAADVSGVLVNETFSDQEDHPEEQRVMSEEIHEEKSSHLKSEDVIQHEERSTYLNTMEKTKILEDIEQLLSEKAAAKDFSDEAIANITKVFHEAIREKSEEYVVQIEKAKAEKAEAEGHREELDKTISELQHQLKDTEEKLGSLEVEKQERQAQARFDARMTAIEEGYELDDADRKVLASEVSALGDTEEAFAEYQEKVSIVFKNKNKEYLEQLAAEMEAHIEAEVAKRLETTASATETLPKEDVESSESVVEQSLDQATPADAGQIPNNNGESTETEETLRERFTKAFKDSVKVSY
jgi:hypothetical protein